ncbi:hypothetical protein B0H13DRAFT_2371949 [Mycena leptocephala]|nr:hypothetical protein B0H13DRAFT_2371949 [Mycena leptocephala]
MQAGFPAGEKLDNQLGVVFSSHVVVLPIKIVTYSIKTPTINGVIDGWFVDATSDPFPSAPVFRSPTIALASSVSSWRHGLASKTPQVPPSHKTPFILLQASPSSLQAPPNLSASSPSFNTSPGLNTLYPKLLPSASYFSSPPVRRLPTIADHVYCDTSCPLYHRGVGFTFEGYALFLVPLRAPLQHPHLSTQVVDDVQREVDDSISTAGDEATSVPATATSLRRAGPARLQDDAPDTATHRRRRYRAPVPLAIGSVACPRSLTLPMRMVPLLPPHMRLLAPPRVSLLGGNRMMWRPRPPPDQHLAGDTLGLLPAFAVGEGCATRRGRGVIVHACAGGMPAVDLRPLHLLANVRTA